MRAQGGHAAGTPSIASTFSPSGASAHAALCHRDMPGVSRRHVPACATAQNPPATLSVVRVPVFLMPSSDVESWCIWWPAFGAGALDNLHLQADVVAGMGVAAARLHWQRVEPRGGVGRFVAEIRMAAPDHAAVVHLRVLQLGSRQPGPISNSRLVRPFSMALQP